MMFGRMMPRILVLLLEVVLKAAVIHSIVCAEGEYDAGYEVCLPKQTHWNPLTCPLSKIDPPPQGRAKCTGSTPWKHIHVGGADPEWVDGSYCLTTAHVPKMRGGGPNPGPCQGGSEEECNMRLKYAGCVSGDGHGVCTRTHPEQRIATTFLLSTTVHSAGGCCMRCYTTETCASFNYNKSTNECQLAGTDDISLLTADTTFDWYQCY